jgi:ribosomal protein S18 acetylase RimI-like enzyme
MHEPRVLRFSRSLSSPGIRFDLPAGFALAPFSPAEQAKAVHRLLLEGYSAGGGQVDVFENWWPSLSGDDEFDPELVFAVLDREQRLAAVAICWTSAFVKDLVVAREARRKGVASALLGEIFRTFRARGASRVSLKVHAENRAAISLYRSLGMDCVEHGATDAALSRPDAFSP